MVNKFLLILFFFLMLANIGMLYDMQYGMRSNIAQEIKPPLQSPQTTKTKPALAQHSPAQLASHFDHLSAELTTLTNTVNRLSKTTTQNSKNSQDSQQHVQQQNQEQTGAHHQAIIFSESIEKVLELGVLDHHAWQSMEQDIVAMSRQENKVFWEKMMAKIAQDEFVIGDYED